MTLNVEALGKLLCERLCKEVAVERRPDNALMIRTQFEFPDGDRYPIHLSEIESGGLRLSDRGHTLMHMSCEHDVDSFLDGPRGLLLERIMGESGLQWDGGAFCLDTSPEGISDAIFRFGQALTRVYDLTLLSRSVTGSTFYDDLANLIPTLVDDTTTVQSDYQPNVPNPQNYQVDYCIEGKNLPVFLYGVPNRDKARLTTIMLSYFHLNSLQFESILVFENQSEIPRLDLARLSDVGGDMISSLESHNDLKRKLDQRVA